MLKAMLSPITRPSSSHKVTFRCRDHDNLAREIVLVLVQAWDQQLCKRLPKKSKKGILVQYCTVRYSTVLSKCPLRFVSSRSPLLHIPQSLSRRKIFEEDVRCRIALRALIWPYQIRWPDCDPQVRRALLLEGPLAREQSNAEDARNITQAEKTVIKSSLHGKVTSLRGRWDPHLA